MPGDFQSVNLGIEATVAGQINDAPVELARLGDSVQLTLGPVIVMLDRHRAAVLGQALLTMSVDTAPDG